MSFIDFTILPKQFLTELYLLKEFYIFVFQKENTNYLKNKLFKIYKRHSDKVSIQILYYNLYNKRLDMKNLYLTPNEIIDKIFELLLFNNIVFLKINDNNYNYGYVIYPRDYNIII